MSYRILQVVSVKPLAFHRRLLPNSLF